MMSKICPGKFGHRDCGFYDYIVRSLANSKYDFCSPFRKTALFVLRLRIWLRIWMIVPEFLVSLVTDAFY